MHVGCVRLGNDELNKSRGLSTLGAAVRLARRATVQAMRGKSRNEPSIMYLLYLSMIWHQLDGQCVDQRLLRKRLLTVRIRCKRHCTCTCALGVISMRMHAHACACEWLYMHVHGTHSRMYVL